VAYEKVEKYKSDKNRFEKGCHDDLLGINASELRWRNEKSLYYKSLVILRFNMRLVLISLLSLIYAAIQIGSIDFDIQLRDSYAHSKVHAATLVFTLMANKKKRIHLS